MLSAGCRARDAFISACVYKIVANAVDATRHRAGQQKYCAPYKCPKEKEAVQNRLSFKAKKGGCDALNSGVGMQMRGSRVPSHSNKGPSSFFGGRRHVHASTP